MLDLLCEQCDKTRLIENYACQAALQCMLFERIGSGATRLRVFL